MQLAPNANRRQQPEGQEQKQQAGPNVSAVWKAMAEALPYLANAAKVRVFLDDWCVGAKNVSDVVERVRKFISACTDITLRTDMRIILNYLEKSLQKGWP